MTDFGSQGWKNDNKKMSIDKKCTYRGGFVVLVTLSGDRIGGGGGGGRRNSVGVGVGAGIGVGVGVRLR